jgi:hypothetical protein
MARSCLVVVLIACLSTPVTFVAAEGKYGSASQMSTGVREAREEITGEEMIADAVFLRPLGLASLVLGTAAFVATLIFTIPTQQVEEAGRQLVVNPAKYTFVRPLGQPYSE